MNKETHFQQGHTLSDFLEECLFNGRSCSATYLSHFVHHRFGNCITFNKKVEGKELLQVSETGINSGLILHLNLRSCKSLPTVHIQGAKVIIHDPSEIPSPEEDGFIVGPGYEAIISLKQTIMRRLPLPYKDRCLNYKAEGKKNIFNKNDCAFEPAFKNTILKIVGVLIRP
ncbi:acid-sensing ion channel 4 [Trichonephila clavipes]|nr:acid-sensing ion channel 4 [Trichonephila clavipes]